MHKNVVLPDGLIHVVRQPFSNGAIVLGDDALCGARRAVRGDVAADDALIGCDRCRELVVSAYAAEGLWP